MNGKRMIYVIGGGLLGLLTARELRRAGEEVTLLDAGRTGIASWAGGGILSPLYPWRQPAPINALAFWSQERYRGLAMELGQATGIEVEWIDSGLLTIGATDTDLALGWGAANGVPLEVRSELVDIEPSVNPLLRHGIWMPTIGQIRNPRLLEALRLELLQRKVVIRSDTEVSGFVTKAGQLDQIRTSAGDVQANRCVVAAGAWSGPLLETIGLRLPIRPVRGQMILFKATPDLLHRIVLKEGVYAVPRRDGRILVGSTVEEAGFDTSTTPEAASRLRSAAGELVPALADCEIERQWAGLRPGSPEGVPYIGEHPEIRGLFVCTGHYRNGIVMGPASARLVADLTRGEAPPLDPSPYRLGCS